MLAILTGLVIALWIDRMFFNKKDKGARNAIEELADDFNREVSFYDFIEEASVNIKCFSKEMEKDRELFQVKTELHDRINNVSERVEKVAETAERTDKSIAQGVDELAKHLKLEIVPFKKPAEDGFKIVKRKK